ncbi:MAG: hypothetical protein U5N55_10935, partial [Cypionkella sp.]|nr:hypothetical protein [Cypionkella sp.]
HMQKSLFTLSFGFAALLWATQHAVAQTPPAQQCGPREAVLMALAERYGEGRRAIGLAGTAHVMEMFTNAETGTWTITATTAQGMMCLIASGTGYEAVDEAAPAKGEPA